MDILLEAIQKLKKYSDYDTVLSYEDLPVTIYTKYHDEEGPSYYSGGESGYYDEKDIKVDYDLNVDGSEIISALSDLLDEEDAEEAKKNENIDDLLSLSYDETDEYVARHFDELFKKHEGELLSMFREQAEREAQAEAQQNFDCHESLTESKREIITVNGIDCDVEYNNNVYSRKDIENFLKDGLKDEDILEQDEDEYELHNYAEVVDKIRQKKKQQTKVIDCSEFIEFQLSLGDSLDDIPAELKRFGFTEVKALGDNKYELTGPKNAFSFYNHFMTH